MAKLFGIDGGKGGQRQPNYLRRRISARMVAAGLATGLGLLGYANYLGYRNITSMKQYQLRLERRIQEIQEKRQLQQFFGKQRHQTMNNVVKLLDRQMPLHETFGPKSAQYAPYFQSFYRTFGLSAKHQTAVEDLHKQTGIPLYRLLLTLQARKMKPEEVKKHLLRAMKTGNVDADARVAYIFAVMEGHKNARLLKQAHDQIRQKVDTDDIGSNSGPMATLSTELNSTTAPSVSKPHTEYMDNWKAIVSNQLKLLELVRLPNGNYTLTIKVPSAPAPKPEIRKIIPAPKNANPSKFGMRKYQLPRRRA